MIGADPTTVSERRGGRPAARPPVALILLGTGAAAFFVVPLAALLLRAPWRHLPSLLTDPAVLAALRLSAMTTASATALSLVFGVPLAWLLARAEFRGKSLVRAFVLLPMVLPPVVGGMALLLALGRRGLVGQWLDGLLGVTLPFTTAAAVSATTFVAMPFLVITVEAAFRNLDSRMEDAAVTLGAGTGTVFWRITLPMAAPSIAAGASLSAARALGEFGATITFAGNVEGRTQTLPLAVLAALESNNADAAIAMSLVMMAVSMIILLALRRYWLALR